MHIGCSICKELYISHSVVFVVSCGHLYHEACISQWLKHNGTCPQCRAKLKNSPYRVYFNIDEAVENDPANLQYKLDQITYELEKRRQEEKKTRELIANTENICSNLRQHALETEAKLAEKQSMLQAVKRDNKILRTFENSYKTTKKELEECKKTVNTYLNVETMIKGSIDEVKRVVNSTPITEQSVRQLATYVEVLKTQNKKTEQKYRRLYSEHQSLSEKYRRLTEEEQRLQEQVVMLTLTIESIQSTKSQNEGSSNTGRPLTGLTSSLQHISKSPEETSTSKESFSLRPPDDGSFVIDLDEDLGFPINTKLKLTKEKSLSRPSINPANRLKHSPSDSSIPHSSCHSQRWTFDGMGGLSHLKLSAPMSKEEVAELSRKRTSMHSKAVMNIKKRKM